MADSRMLSPGAGEEEEDLGQKMSQRIRSEIMCTVTIKVLDRHFGDTGKVRQYTKQRLDKIEIGGPADRALKARSEEHNCTVAQ